jgi:hypothetical protein
LLPSHRALPGCAVAEITERLKQKAIAETIKPNFLNEFINPPYS